MADIAVTKSFDDEYDHFRAFQEAHELTACWSIYEQNVRMDQDIPLSINGWILVYKEHRTIIYGATWGDLYKACDRVIKMAGDVDHCYIEQINPNRKTKTLTLVTGS